MDWTAMGQAVESAIRAGDANAEARAIVAIQDRVRDGENIPADECRQLFNVLRKHGRYRHLVALGDLCGFDSESATVRRLAAQGLIEEKQFDRAIRELEKTNELIARELAAIPPPAPGTLAGARESLELHREQNEVHGLLGRLYKQRSVDGAKQGRSEEARAKDALKSMRFYLDAYHASPIENLWHGINYVAVARYAYANLGMDPPEDAPQEVAQKILEDLQYLDLRGMMSVWDYATRGEAELALGRIAAARNSYALYLAHPGIDESMRLSSRRQLQELWGLPDSHELVQLFVRKPDENLQARFKDAPYDAVGKDPVARARASTVARLGASDKVGDGTGFLFDGVEISDKLHGQPLLLTCFHVCPEQVPADRLVVVFFEPHVRGRNVISEHVKILWSSPREELDATLLLLDVRLRDITPAPVAKQPFAVGDYAFIIGHPLGGGKLVSRRDNDIREIGDPRFYYNSAADPGSSGSPVFNERWELIGIHRAGPKVKELNQGTRMDRILEELRKRSW